MNIQRRYRAEFLGKAKKFIQGLRVKDRAKIAAAITTLEEGNFQSVETKTLQGEIKELIVKSHRLVFFIHHHLMYFVSGFTKKTRKTLKNEIENAENIFEIVNSKKK